MSDFQQLLKQRISEMHDRDPGELHQGDADPSDVSTLPARTWHPSWLDAKPPEIPEITCRDHGRSVLAKTLEEMRKPPVRIGRIPKNLNCWHDTPEPFRKLICRAASLDIAVISKLDRDLTELEKAAIRGAAQRLRDRAEALFAI
ncbi:hypothetical protein [Lacisediminimonas profundi]|uniref:hypothetical protein n=1 Tax=Lacisediminimonas profundi TaxID=2603856 RepID=UPI00124B2C6D|nr:hypothetical protein [Lacisediminimonas profundi]